MIRAASSTARKYIGTRTVKITIEIDTDRLPYEKEKYRNLAGFLLQSIGDFDKEETNDAPGTHAGEIPKGKDLVPNTVTGLVASAAAASGAANTTSNMAAPIFPTAPSASVEHAPGNFIPPPPPLVPADSNIGEDTPESAREFIETAGREAGNVLHFPVPPPPPPSEKPWLAPTADIAAPIPPAPLVLTAAGVGTAASAPTSNGPSGVDSAGMVYDARIHQKSGNKKKDGTWKIIKGLDPAIVAAVTAELAARKGAAAPVTLPQRQSSVPVPSVPSPTTATAVPAPPAAAPMPIPPVPPVGTLSTSGFRELVDKLTAATKASQITPAKVNEICQGAGAPNLMELNKMPELIPEVNSRVDAFLAGLG